MPDPGLARINVGYHVERKPVQPCGERDFVGEPITYTDGVHVFLRSQVFFSKDGTYVELIVLDIPA